MRDRVSPLAWLRVMPSRRPLSGVDAAQEARDIAEHEVARLMTSDEPEAREQLAFWQEELRRAERAYQETAALEEAAE